MNVIDMLTENLPKECVHCGGPMRYGEDGGLMAIRLFSPVAGETKAMLCGPCALQLGEFLCPQIVDEPDYVVTKTELMADYKARGWA